MENKNKVYGVLLLCMFLTAFFLGGYSIGYHKAKELYSNNWEECINSLIECNDGYGKCIDLVEKCSNTLNECTEQLKEEETNYKLELLENGHNNSWCDTNYSKRCKIEKISGIWIYYSENCTEKQVSDFIEENSSFYDDFSECYIGRSV